MLKIYLEELQFFAYHGLYEEERILGNEYVVNINIDYLPNQKIIHSINETVDYTAVYDLLAERMKHPTDLLETIATGFCYQVMEKFPSVQNIEFNIKKLNPPILKMIGHVGVSFQLKRSEL
jgi:dihydroneopterin aldolase